MKTTSLRARALACALLATTAYCGLTAQPAAAQTAREHRALDSNGVDLTHGDFVMAFVEGSIGSGDAELALVRSKIGSGNGSWHVSSGGHVWDGLHLIKTMGTGGTSISVNKDSRFERFAALGTLPTGSSLALVGAAYQYRTADGTTVVFGDPSGSSNSSSPYCNGSFGQGNCTQLPLSIAAPDGKSVTLSWEVFQSCTGDIIGDDLPDCSYWGRIESVSNSFGYRIAFTYEANGSSGSGGAPPPDTWQRRRSAALYNDAVSTTSPQASTSYSYPSTGVVEVIDTGGRSWRFAGIGLNVTAVRRPGAGSDTIAVTYGGPLGEVSAVTNEGVATNYSRSVSGSTATMTVTQVVPGGTSPVTTIVSDLNIGRPTSVTDPLSHVTGYQYDTSGRLKRVTQDEGNYVEYTYDARGNVTQTEAVPKGGSGATAVTSASYDSTCSNPATCNQPNSTTDARGNVTDYTYDPTHGGLLTATGPAPTSGAVRPQTRYAYTLTNGEYRLTGISQCRTAASCAGGSDEVRTSIDHDANGNVVRSSSGSGDGALTATTEMAWDPVGNLTEVDGPLFGPADTSHIRYNGARQVTGTISPDPDGSGPLKPRAVRNSYAEAPHPAAGFLVKVEQGNVHNQSSDLATFAAAQAVETDYENARPVTTRLMSGSTVHALAQTGYDALGRPKCTVQRMDLADFGSTLPGACTLTSPAGADGPDRIVETVYDLAGRVAQVKTALGTADQADEVTATYTDNGLVETVTDAENNKTTYVYDGHDRLHQTQFPSTAKGAGTSNSSDYEQPTYESLAGGTRTSGLVASFRNRANETTAFGYDALGRLSSKDRPGSEPDVAYTYDLLGQTLSASQSGDSLTFGYDALGRNVRQTGASGDYRSEYDLAGRRTKITHPDNFYVDQDYLVTGEMVKIRENGATSGVGVLATYDYDQLGRRSSLTLGNGAVTNYAYDAASRLQTLTLDITGTTSDNAITLAYNPASQIVSREATNTLYAWTGHGSGTTGTTADGLNRLASWNATLTYDAKGNMTSDGTTSYGYDSENRQILNGAATFLYDPLGRISGVAATPNGTPVVGYESYIDGLVAERYPGSSNVARRHVFGPGIDEPIVWYEGSGTADRRFLQADERGSIVAVIDSSGVLQNINRYDEHGRVEWTNPYYLARFAYTGQRYFGASGIYYYKNRMYDPKSGRFMQPDPIGYGGGMNGYAYVGGDPVNASDPLGLTPQAVICTGTRLGCGAHHDGGGSGLSPGSSGASEWVGRANMAAINRSVVPYTATVNLVTGATSVAFGGRFQGTTLSGASAQQFMAGQYPGLFNAAGQTWNGGGFTGGGGGRSGGGGASESWGAPEGAAQSFARTHSRLMYLELTGKILPPGVVLSPNGLRLLEAVPTGSALKDDPYHRAAAFVRADAAFFGRFTSMRGNDGQIYLHVFLPGKVNDMSGNFHYIVDPRGRLTHQRFER